MNANGILSAWFPPSRTRHPRCPPYPGQPWRDFDGVGRASGASPPNMAFLADPMVRNIWDTVTDDLPTLRDAVDAELAGPTSETEPQ